MCLICFCGWRYFDISYTSCTWMKIYVKSEVVSSILAGFTIIYRFHCGFICVYLCQSIKIKTSNMYIAITRAQFKIDTHGCWNWHLYIPDGFSVVQCSHGHAIGIVFWHSFGGMKRTCWTIGSWRCCLSSEVVSSTPTGSTIIYRFPCGFICFTCAWASKSNKQICMKMYAKINGSIL